MPLPISCSYLSPNHGGVAVCEMRCIQLMPIAVDYVTYQPHSIQLISGYFGNAYSSSVSAVQYYDGSDRTS
jgi:hypothetical protein